MEAVRISVTGRDLLYRPMRDMREDLCRTQKGIIKIIGTGRNRYCPRTKDITNIYFQEIQNQKFLKSITNPVA